MNVENQTMKIRHLILSGLAVAAMGIAAVGCNENPLTPPGGTGNAPTPASGVQAVSLSASSVGLKWLASTDSGAITYRVSWIASDGTDSNSASGIASTSYTANSLSASKAYTFYVYAVRSSVASTAATINWAGAQRYGSTTTIRMYETDASAGSGLILDPSKGGPANISVKANPASNVQLAIYTNGPDPNTFSVGPAYAFTEYRQADAFDQTVYISDSTYPAQSLNEWYGVNSIETKISSNGNVRAFELPVSQTGGAGQGFYVRTGTSGNYHYARIFIKNNGGKLLQGSAPSRYVEMEISYQQTANVPYAKPSMRYTPGNRASTTGH